MSEAERREEAVFEVALHLPADQRAAYLDKTCAEDANLRCRVEILLSAFERAGGFMKQPVVSLSPSEPEGATLRLPTEKPGDKIGRYKLLEQIGEGGCGVVYVAEQEEPMRRRVALKVIKLGMDTKQVIARFDAERQALAIMDHPNIARVLDAGATETGRPYFVMELVRGVKITEYCEKHQLSTRDQLQLFIQVCRAIQHAHQKGIIHRDIKPSNILVTVNDGVPIPKVIDFGIAKATQGRLTDQTVYTAFEQFIGTPAYMSPEQAVMTSLDIDTRTDIYSLGVLIYELLTGKPPFDAKALLAAGLDEMRRTIREVEPVKPSTRMTRELAAADVRRPTSESASSRRRLQEVRGDLDWIVMKCLDKDRNRRYETANGLARDVERHLENEPVVARPPSRLYRFQKTVQRNKLPFTAAMLVVASLVAGLAASTGMFFKMRAEKTKAQTQAAKSEQLSKFLSDALFAAGPAIARGRDATVLREILEKAGERVGKELKNQPDVQGDLWFTIGMTHWDIGDHPRAITNLQLAVQRFRSALGPSSSKLALALTRLGRCQCLEGKVDEGRAMAESGLAMARGCGDPKRLVLCLEDMAASLKPYGLLSPAGVPYLREALDLRVQLNTNVATASTPDGLAEARMRLAQLSTNLAEGEAMAREALAVYEKHLQPDDLAIANGLFTLGQILLGRGNDAAAEDALRKSFALHEKLYDKKHPRMPIVRRFFLEALARQGKWDGAEALVRSQFADISIVPESWLMLVRLKAARGDWPGAIDEAKRAHEQNLAAIDYDICLNLAIGLLHEQRRDEYSSLCHELLDRAQWADHRGKSVAAQISLLLPVSGADFGRACELADQLSVTNDASYVVLSDLAKALADYRRGQFAAATNSAARVTADAAAADCSCTDAASASAWFVEASALARLRQMDAARAALARGAALTSKPPVDFNAGLWGGGWGEWTIADFLRREASAVIEAQSASSR